MGLNLTIGFREGPLGSDQDWIRSSGLNPGAFVRGSDARRHPRACMRPVSSHEALGSLGALLAGDAIARLSPLTWHLQNHEPKRVISQIADDPLLATANGSLQLQRPIPEWPRSLTHRSLSVGCRSGIRSGSSGEVCQRSPRSSGCSRHPKRAGES